MMTFFLRVLPLFLLSSLAMPLSLTLPGSSSLERQLLSNKIALEVEYLRLYEGMSMEDGKGSKGKGKGMVVGKGKESGGKKNMVECTGKGKGKGGMMMCDKSSTKGSMMESKKGKGMSKTATKFPSQSVGPSICKLTHEQVECSLRHHLTNTFSYLPAPVPSGTTSPSSLPVSTPVPTFPPDEPDIVVVLSPYLVFYQIEQTRIPTMEDFAQLSAFTENYLNSNFVSIFSGTETTFVISTTNITGSEFRLGQPVRVDYNTTVTFGFQSSTVPTLDELNALLAGTFEGTNGEAYAAAVSTGLDTSNIFSTTTSVSFQVAPSADANENAAARITAISVVTTLAVLALAFTAVIHRRREYEKMGRESILTDASSTTSELFEDDPADSGSVSFPAKFRFSGEPLIDQQSDSWEINENADKPSDSLEATSEGNDRGAEGCSKGGDQRETTSSQSTKIQQNLEVINI
jgi:hypothetical protein